MLKHTQYYTPQGMGYGTPGPASGDQHQPSIVLKAVEERPRFDGSQKKKKKM